MGSYTNRTDDAPAYRLDAEGGERLRIGDFEVVIRASADTTGGAFTVFEECDPVDTPLHVHEHEDELFYVLEGEATFICGDERSTGGPGSTAYLPRGVPHTLRAESETVRALVVMTPCGPLPYFDALSVPATGRTLPDAPAHLDPAAVEAALAEVGVRVVGPPPGR